jgi:TrpR-related protein YerC/YecD
MAAVEGRPESVDATRDADPLCEALLQLLTVEEAWRFLRDLTTPGELQALAERWRVAQLLDAGGKSYREISAETGSSTTTVTRVARFLAQEDHQGYRLVLDRLKEKTP